MSNPATAPTTVTRPICRPKPDRRRSSHHRFFEAGELASFTAGVKLLVTGPQEAADVFLQRVSPLLGAPVQLLCGGPLNLPNAECTLVLRDVDALDDEQQQVLLRWLGDEQPGPRHVISITEKPLYERVQAGAFDSALYYRLNVIYLDVTPS